MTRDEVIQRALATVKAEGWPWSEPVHVQRSRRWMVCGPIEWHVMTNVTYRGGNVNIWIDDQSGVVTRKGFARR
jgi:hypothetical protein